MPNQHIGRVGRVCVDGDDLRIPDANFSSRFFVGEDWAAPLTCDEAIGRAPLRYDRSGACVANGLIVQAQPHVRTIGRHDGAPLKRRRLMQVDLVGRWRQGEYRVEDALAGGKSDPISLDTVSTTMTGAKEGNDGNDQAEADSWQ